MTCTEITFKDETGCRKAQALHFDAPLMMLYVEMLALLKFGNELEIKHSAWNRGLRGSVGCMAPS